MDTKLYVGNLSYETTEDDLRRLFTQAGTINDVALIKDRDTGSSKGFAFVTMNSQEDADKAIIQFNGQNLDNRELKVNFARPRESTYDSNQGNGYRSNSRSRGGGR
jgi:RNA recognition motif-containing protein